MSWPGAGGRSTRLPLHAPSPSHEPGAHYLDNLLDGKAVGDHQPCSPQSTQTGEQFKPVICRCAGNSCRSRARPHGHVPAAWRSSPPRQTTAWLAIYPCGQLPLGPGGFGTGKGSASAVVVTSASLREKLIFIGSIAVWDTIGTLPPSGIEIVTLFRFVDCCVMGRKAPRKRLVRRVMACPTGVPPSTRTSLGAPPLHGLRR